MQYWLVLDEVHEVFIDVKDAVKNLMTLNQMMMFVEENMLRDQAHRAIMPGTITVISAFVFS